MMLHYVIVEIPRINRAYRDAQNRLLWRNKTCPAHGLLIRAGKRKQHHYCCYYNIMTTLLILLFWLLLLLLLPIQQLLSRD